MKFALDTCIHGEYSNPVLIAELASLAEKAGWDGFFIWDGIGGSEPTADPWVTLSLIASCTSKIRIGTAVTPIARRRPWKLARETTSVDWISQGRLTLGVGLGDHPSTEYQQFGENSNIRTLADKLDEGLEVLTGLWTGKEFSYKGIHFNIDKPLFCQYLFNHLASQYGLVLTGRIKDHLEELQNGMEYIQFIGIRIRMK